mgnify:CR=1 FL=1
MTWFVLPVLLLTSPAQDSIIIIADLRRSPSIEEQLGEVEKPSLETANPEGAARETPIIVEGDRGEVPDSVILGSRIPRRSFYTNGNVATSTGIAGLTPGAGLEPFAGTNRVGKRITSTCISDNEAIGERAACLLLEGQSAFDAADYIGAADIYRYLLGSDDFAPAERLEGGRRLIDVASVTEDMALREEALIRLVNTDLLDPMQRGSVRRNLVDLALRRNATDLAIARLEEYVAIVPDDAQALANLAVLRRNHGRDGAETAMQQAIAVREAAGGEVPQGWRDLAAGLPFTPEAPEVSELP